MSVVAKMNCHYIQTQDVGYDTKYHKVMLGAVYGAEGENKDFSVTEKTSSPDRFTHHGSYYGVPIWIPMTPFPWSLPNGHLWNF